MLFQHSKCYGRDCFYPIGKEANEFVAAFPHSSGQRKCLTINQIKLLQNLGVECEIENEIIKEFMRKTKQKRKKNEIGN